MSLELVDLRAKVTPRTDVVLEAQHRATGKEKSEIVREILDAWAGNRIHEASMVHQLLDANGLSGKEGA